MNTMTLIHHYSNIGGYTWNNPIIRIMQDGSLIMDLDAFAPQFYEIDGMESDTTQMNEYIAVTLSELTDHGIELTDAVIEDVHNAAAAWVEYSTRFVGYESQYLR